MVDLRYSIAFTSSSQSLVQFAYHFIDTFFKKEKYQSLYEFENVTVYFILLYITIKVV